ncbi:hydroxyethylthiazole kinase [Solibacillus sp. R5-41]|uniref:hydroxyethylthiazole kinase n=1 Tax=Solibacillus sp. R5-41 TaxID=2048654 RepID=UPI000C126EEF|nr:hydroxyethylthiazole kinase [Solibacillus sp. R5-41]ATP39171.1 hydroxyethylthiazole kinase [Solibacillus sp. R5-41]
MTMYNIHKKKPLVHCITNYVVANFTANGLLAIGASPVMADDKDEVAEMVAMADALLINIGTINSWTFEAMLIAGKKANELNVPTLLDPVGVGATEFRKKIVQQLLEQIRFDAIRCNVGELAAIAGVQWESKGVDSGEGDMDTVEVAKQVAKKWNTTVIVTGKTDIVTDGHVVEQIAGGDVRMTQITGSGCLLSAICSAALSVEGDKITNLQQVLQQYKQIAAEASGEAQYMGSVQVSVLNGLEKYSLREQL